MAEPMSGISGKSGAAGLSKGSWLPVIGLMFSAFIFNTSEFIPIGLLSGIAADFGISESAAGMLITVYAWVVAIASLPLMLVFAKTENKRLMLSIVGLFVLSHIASGFAANYNMLMISRMGVACSHAIFWSIVTPVAVKVAPEGKGAAALSMVVSGSSFAMIVGLPLGRTIGLLVGWRAAFLIIAAIAAIIFCILAAVLKKTPSDSSFSLRKLPVLIKSPALLGIFLLTLVTITGHFTAYSYIEPFLGQVAGFGDTAITMILAMFGVVGIAGSIIFSGHYDRTPKPFRLLAVAGLCVLLLALHPASFNPVSTVLICILWGFAINSYNLTFQTEIIRNAPDGTSVAMSIYSGIYNIGIGTGALIGGSVCSGIGIPYIGYIGGAIALVAAIYFIRKLMPILPGGDSALK